MTGAALECANKAPLVLKTGSQRHLPDRALAALQQVAGEFAAHRVFEHLA